MISLSRKIYYHQNSFWLGLVGDGNIPKSKNGLGVVSSQNLLHMSFSKMFF